MNQTIPMNEEKRQAMVSLKTCRGQIDGILQMIEQGRYCIDIANQIMAAQSQLKRANKLILTQHMHFCVEDAIESGNAKEKTQEIIDVLSKLIG